MDPMGYIVDICWYPNTQKELDHHGRGADDYSHPPIQKKTPILWSNYLVSSLTKPWFIGEPEKGLLWMVDEYC